MKNKKMNAKMRQKKPSYYLLREQTKTCYSMFACEIQSMECMVYRCHKYSTYTTFGEDEVILKKIYHSH